MIGKNRDKPIDRVTLDKLMGNITVTGGAGKGATSVTIALPGGSLANNSKKPGKSKNK